MCASDHHTLDSSVITNCFVAFVENITSFCCVKTKNLILLLISRAYNVKTEFSALYNISMAMENKGPTRSLCFSNPDTINCAMSDDTM